MKRRDFLKVAGGLAMPGLVGTPAGAAEGKTVEVRDFLESENSDASAIKQGISEHYDSVSGQPLGMRDCCMSCTLVTMMLDGLTRTDRLKAKTK